MAARWIVKPVNLFDCDIPITVAVAYLFTTPERAKDMKQKPVYILNHAAARPKPRSVEMTLEECEDSAESLGRRLYEGAGIGASDLSFENMYDGYTLFHHLMMEGLRYRGVNKGEGLDFYQTDISIEGPNPVSPSVAMPEAAAPEYGCTPIASSRSRGEQEPDRSGYQLRWASLVVHILEVATSLSGVQVQIRFSR